MAVVRLQCPACAAIVKITDELASQHPVVRCAQCQGLVQVAEHRLPDKATKSSTEEKPRLKSGKRLTRKNSVPVGLIVGIVVGVLTFVGVGLGSYYLVTRVTMSKAERLLVNSIEFLDKTSTIIESMQTADDVPGAMQKFLNMQGDLEQLKKDSQEVKQEINAEESKQLQEKYETKLKDAAQRAMTSFGSLMGKPQVMAAMRKYEQENGGALAKMSAGMNMGNVFGNMPFMPNPSRPPMAGNNPPSIPNPSNNENTGNARSSGDRFKLDAAIANKKGCLTGIASTLESIKDSTSFTVAMSTLKDMKNDLVQLNRDIKELEDQNYRPESANARRNLQEFESINRQIGVQLGRLERIDELSSQLGQLTTMLASAGLATSSSGTEVAGNNPPPANPFEPAAGNNSGRSGNTPPPANPFEPATGNNAGNAKNNPFEPAPSKSGGSMPNRGSSALDDTIGRLTGGDWVKKRDALNELQSAKVEDDRRKEVLDALFNLFDDKDIHSKVDVLKVYKKWASTQEQKERLGTIAETLLADTWVKKDILRFYADNKVTSASTEVARKLKDVFDRKEAAECLIAIGSEAEPAVLPHLSDLDSQVRHIAIEVLARIGTRKSVPELQKLNNDRNVGLAARQAIKIIMARK
jgi:hypothetical protein